MRVLVSQLVHPRVQALRARQLGIDAIIVLEQVRPSPFTRMGTSEGLSSPRYISFAPVSTQQITQRILLAMAQLCMTSCS